MFYTTIEYDLGESTRTYAVQYVCTLYMYMCSKIDFRYICTRMRTVICLFYSSSIFLFNVSPILYSKIRTYIAYTMKKSNSLYDFCTVLVLN